MQFYSTNKQSPAVSFKEATIKGQAPDKGLYFPEYIPQLDAAFIKNIEQFSNEEIAYRVIAPYVGKEMSEDTLGRIVSETVNFPIPLVPVSDSISSLELFHGPTLAFKDIGARFMSRCLREAVGTRTGQATRTGLATSSGLTSSSYRTYLRMRSPIPGMPALPDYPAILYQYSTDHRIGSHMTSPFTGQFNTAEHVFFVSSHVS